LSWIELRLSKIVLFPDSREQDRDRDQRTDHENLPDDEAAACHLDQRIAQRKRQDRQDDDADRHGNVVGGLAPRAGFRHAGPSPVDSHGTLGEHFRAINDGEELERIVTRMCAPWWRDDFGKIRKGFKTPVRHAPLDR
jgi:hypothetical protein